MGPTNGEYYTWMFGIDAAGRIFYGDYKTNVGGHVTLTGNVVDDEEWYHIAVLQDAASGGLSLFQNGNLVSSYAESGAFDAWGASSNTGFGMVHNWTTDDDYYPGISTYFAGSLDDIGFWNRSLTGEELALLSGSVPEPTIVALLGLALAGMGFSRKKKLN